MNQATPLEPTLADTAVPVVYNIVAGGTAGPLPANITCYVEAMPLVRGMFKKIIHTPTIPSLTSTVGTTFYTPDPNTQEDLIARFAAGYHGMMRDDYTPAGSINTYKDDSKIAFNCTNATGTISAKDLEIITLYKTKKHSANL